MLLLQVKYFLEQKISFTQCLEETLNFIAIVLFPVEKILNLYVHYLHSFFLESCMLCNLNLRPFKIREKIQED